MVSIFDFKQQRTASQALLFYVCHLLIVLVSAGLAGMTVATHAHGISALSAARLVGQLVATVYSCAICAAIIIQRNLQYKYYTFFVIVLPATFLLGGFAGLIVPAFLTTRQGSMENDRFSHEHSDARFGNLQRSGDPFGRRYPIIR